jgi:hypothetical protein
MICLVCSSHFPRAISSSRWILTISGLWWSGLFGSDKCAVVLAAASLAERSSNDFRITFCASKRNIFCYRISTSATEYAQHTHPSAKRMISSELYAVAEYLMLSNSSQQDSSASQARLTDSADTAVERFARGPVSALLIKRQAS